nr:phosphocholine cytidylyltransferase family protein [uncultured Actinoplanes sp.]
MRVIVPAAGLGERLLPHTSDRPKCLVPVGGTPIMGRLMTQLHEIGVSEVVCVVGYRGEMIKDYVGSLSGRPRVAFVENPQFATTNSIYSLYSSFAYWDGGIAVVDSDILVSTRLLTMVLDGDDTAMVIDAERTRAEIDMAVEVRDGAVWHLDKELPDDRVTGEFFGLSRWTGAGLDSLRRTISAMVTAGETDVWYQFAIRKVAKTLRIRPLYAHRHEWSEVDSGTDLMAANAALAAGAVWGSCR